MLPNSDAGMYKLWGHLLCSYSFPPHSETFEGPWQRESCLFSARIQICMALFSGEAISLVSVEPQVSC